MLDDWEIVTNALDRPASNETLEALRRLQERTEKAERALFNISQGDLGSQYITVQEFAARALASHVQEEQGERLWR